LATIEVKKIQSKGTAIALNSSYPPNKLHSDDSKITDIKIKNPDNPAKLITLEVA